MPNVLMDLKKQNIGIAGIATLIIITAIPGNRLLARIAIVRTPPATGSAPATR